MKVRTLAIGLVLAGATLAAAPGYAQGPKAGGGGGGGSERSSGSAGANAGGGEKGGGSGGGGGSVAMGGSSSSGGGSASASSGGSTFNTPSANSATASNLSFGDRGRRETAPAHRAGYSADRTASAAGDSDQKATPRTAAGSGGNAAGGGSGERAVPRSGAASGAGNSGNGATGTRTRPANDNNTAGAREVPDWSRPRGDRPATGIATDRVGPPPDRNGNFRGRVYDPFYGGYGFYDPYYSSLYGYGCYACSFGLGYGLYSGLGWNPYYFGDAMDPYYSGYGSYSSGVYNTRDQGSLKLKVKPRNAKVYVDGYFVGPVDQFDGAFQKLALNGGRHRVEVRAEGFETAEFDVLITPDQTVTFQGELKRIQ